MILNRNRGYYRPGSVFLRFIRNLFSLARCSGFNIYNNISSVISICSFSAQGIKSNRPPPGGKSDKAPLIHLWISKSPNNT